MRKNVLLRTVWEFMTIHQPPLHAAADPVPETLLCSHTALMQEDCVYSKHNFFSLTFEGSGKKSDNCPNAT